MKIRSLCGGISKTGRNKVPGAKKSVTAALKALSPATRSSVLDVSLTLKTKKAVAKSYDHTIGSGMGLFKTLALRQNKLSNCTRRLIGGSLSLKVNHNGTGRLCKKQNHSQVRMSWLITTPSRQNM